MSKEEAVTLLVISAMVTALTALFCIAVYQDGEPNNDFPGPPD